MSDEAKDPTPAASPVGWFDAYHPSGVKVRLPVAVIGAGPAVSYTYAFQGVTDAIAAGWLANAPGLEAGEHTEEIGYVVRKATDNDGEVTPVLDCYANKDGMNFSFITIYLNNPEQVAEFEDVSGLRLTSLPVYEGRDKIERGKSRLTDAKVIRCNKPFKIVWIDNPRWSKEEAEAAKVSQKMYMVPKKRFIRFGGSAPAKAQQQPHNGKPAGEWKAERVAEATAQEWDGRLSADPTLEEFNDLMPLLAKMNVPTKSCIWEKVKTHAEAAGWQFDRDTRSWFDPNPAGEAAGNIPF